MMHEKPRWLQAARVEIPLLATRPEQGGLVASPRPGEPRSMQRHETLRSNKQTLWFRAARLDLARKLASERLDEHRSGLEVIRNAGERGTSPGAVPGRRLRSHKRGGGQACRSDTYFHRMAGIQPLQYVYIRLGLQDVQGSWEVNGGMMKPLLGCWRRRSGNAVLTHPQPSRPLFAILLCRCSDAWVGGSTWEACRRQIRM